MPHWELFVTANGERGLLHVSASALRASALHLRMAHNTVLLYSMVTVAIALLKMTKKKR